MQKKVRIAIIQDSPIHDNLDACLDKTLNRIEEAANAGANLVVFGETWLCGYPAWLDYCPEMALWDHGPTKKIFQRMYENGVVVGGKETQQIGALAKQYQLAIVIGINEVVTSGPGNGTIYNGLLIFNEQGEIVVHHRKLMPTFTEKLVYGTGDGHGLRTVDTSFGKLGGLICWEHMMPLTRQAMHENGEHIHVALWPKVHEMLQIASRHYAFEGRTFVVAVGQIMQVKDVPDELELPNELKSQPDKMLLNGGSCIIGPNGKYLLEPQFDRIDLIIFDIENVNQVYGERMALDTSGHYNRRDVFQFETNKRRL